MVNWNRPGVVLVYDFSILSHPKFLRCYLGWDIIYSENDNSNNHSINIEILSLINHRISQNFSPPLDNEIQI